MFMVKPINRLAGIGYVTDQLPRKNLHLWAILRVILQKKCLWTRCPLRFFLKNNSQLPLKAASFRTFKAGDDLPNRLATF